MPLKVYIDKSGAGVTERHNDLIKKAFEEMSKASKGKLKFQFVSKKPYDIICMYKPLGSHKGNSWEGAVTHTSTGPHHLEDATIVFHSDDTKFNNHSAFFEIALHEIGHAVGLGHSESSQDVMYGKVSNYGSKTTYSARDIETLAMLYRYRPPADELDMIERHKIEKLSGGNVEKLKVDLPAAKHNAYSDKLISAIKEKLPGSGFGSGSATDTTGGTCTVKVLVDRTGAILKQGILQSSGNSSFDENAKNAVSYASPLPLVDGLRMAEATEMQLKFGSDGSIVDPARKQETPALIAAKPVFASPLTQAPEAVPTPTKKAPAASSQPPALSSPTESSSPPASSLTQMNYFTNAHLDTDMFKVVPQTAQTDQSFGTADTVPSPNIRTSSSPAAAGVPAASSGSLDSWTTKVQRLARADFNRYALPEGTKIEILMRLNHNGTIAELKVKSSSGTGYLDEAALGNCQAHEPYPPAPGPGSGTTTRDVIVTFARD
ncbi:MAG: TonB family protein [Cyanobacteria bacterium HKST-UBA01]|nr:TonB family protein [Cyanobacteria bacterium HKST-UBA01]